MCIHLWPWSFRFPMSTGKIPCIIASIWHLLHQCTLKAFKATIYHHLLLLQSLTGISTCRIGSKIELGITEVWISKMPHLILFNVLIEGFLLWQFPLKHIWHFTMSKQLGIIVLRGTSYLKSLVFGRMQQEVLVAGSEALFQVLPVLERRIMKQLTVPSGQPLLVFRQP